MFRIQCLNPLGFLYIHCGCTIYFTCDFVRCQLQNAHQRIEDDKQNSYDFHSQINNKNWNGFCFLSLGFFLISRPIRFNSICIHMTRIQKNQLFRPYETIWNAMDALFIHHLQHFTFSFFFFADITNSLSLFAIFIGSMGMIFLNYLQSEAAQTNPQQELQAFVFLMVWL